MKIVALSFLVVVSFMNLAKAQTVPPSSTTPVQITGTFNLSDPSISQVLAFSVKPAANMTFTPVQPLQCGITVAGAPMATVTLVNGGGPNLVWTLTGGNTADFVIDPHTGIITVGPNGLTGDLCPAGITAGSLTITASW